MSIYSKIDINVLFYILSISCDLVCVGFLAKVPGFELVFLNYPHTGFLLVFVVDTHLVPEAASLNRLNLAIKALVNQVRLNF